MVRVLVSVVTAFLFAAPAIALQPILSGYERQLRFTEDELASRSAYLFPEIELVAPNGVAGGRFDLYNDYTPENLYVIPSATGDPRITQNGAWVSFEGVRFARLYKEFSAARGGYAWRMDFQDNATVEMAQAALRALYLSGGGSSLPPPYRVIEFRFTDATGAFTQADPQWRFSTSPYGGGVLTSAPGGISDPELADIDGDGDLDLVVGNANGQLIFFENTGSASNPEFTERTGAASPFSQIDLGLRSSAAFGDIDRDGDLDLVVSDDTGGFFLFENTGTRTEPAFTARSEPAPLTADVGLNGEPSLADLDGDGDPDLIVGSQDQGIFYYENLSEGANWQFAARTGQDNPFAAFVDGKYYVLSLAFHDIDDDGDQDAVLSTAYNLAEFLENIGTAEQPDFRPLATKFSVLAAEVFERSFGLSLGDLNGDSRADLVVGDDAGGIYYHPMTLEADDHVIGVTVTEVNQPPVEWYGQVEVSEDDAIDLGYQLWNWAAVRDPEGDAFDLVSVNLDPEDGVIVEGDGRFYYRSPEFDQTLSVGHVREHTIEFVVRDVRGAEAALQTDLLVRGANDPYTAVDDFITITEDDRVILNEFVFANDIDIDLPREFLMMAFDAPAMPGELTLARGELIFEAIGHYDVLASGDSVTEVFDYLATDLMSIEPVRARVSLQIVGENDAPDANDDAIDIGREVYPRDITPFVLANDADVDFGDAFTIVAAAPVIAGRGSVSVQSGRLYYTPPADFAGTSDQLEYTIRDGSGAESTATVTVNLLNAGLAVSVNVAGLGSVAIEPSPYTCTDECSVEFEQGTRVTLRATAAASSEFLSWNGSCYGDSGLSCSRTLDNPVSAQAIFTGPVLRSAILPAARSGSLSGGDLTVFGTLVNAGGGRAAGCRIELADDAPVTLTYRLVNGRNEPIGFENPVTDITEGFPLSYVLALTPIRTTSGAGEDVDVRFVCTNGAAEIIPSVNSVFLSIAEDPVPDIIAIAATPTGDGSLRNASHGGRAAMGVAAVNIGAPADISVSIDNGGAELPLTYTLCQTGPDGVCLVPRSPSVVVSMGADPVLFSVLAVDQDGEATSVPDDAAIARTYLRFNDPDGVTRGLTSVGIVSGNPINLDVARDTLPAGRWSVSMLGENSNRFERGELFVLPDGQALLWTGTGIYSAGITAENYNVRRRNIGGSFSDTTGRTSDLTGYWFPFRQLRLQTSGILASEIMGVFDARSLPGGGTSIASLSGDYAVEGGGSLTIGAEGDLSGTIGDCAATGSAMAADTISSGVTGFSLTLSSCARSTGSGGRAVIYRGLDEGGAPALFLLAAWPNEGFRLVLTPSP